MAKKPTGKKKTMTPAEILRAFRNVDTDDVEPQITALREAVHHREVLIPKLIKIVEDVADDPDHYLDDQESFLPLFSVYLLAQFRETSARDAILRLFALPKHVLIDMTDVMVTAYGQSILASICGGDPAPLLRLAHNEEADPFSRGAAIDALTVQCAWGERSREAVIADLRGLFSSLEKPGDGHVWGLLVEIAADFNAYELAAEVQQVIDEDLIDNLMGDLLDTDLTPPKPGDRAAKKAAQERHKEFLKRCEPIDAAKICSKYFAAAAKWQADYQKAVAKKKAKQKKAKDITFSDLVRNRLGGDFSRN